MRTKSFRIDPYKEVLYFCTDCTWEEAMKWLSIKGIDVDLDEASAEAVTLAHPVHGNAIVMLKFKDTPEGVGVLVHELLHVTFNVLNDRGVKEEAGTEEAAAYLLDHLVSRCLRWLRRSASPRNAARI